MATHEHDAYLTLTGEIKCRICGEHVTKITIAKTGSSVQATKILTEIAVAGEYRATGTDGDYVIYTDGNLEVTIEKIAERRYDVVKRIKTS